MNNPYSAPSQDLASIQPSDSFGGIVQGNLLKIRSGFVFPESCVLCGENCAGHTKKIKMYYAPGWVWFFILLNLIILAIVYIAVRKPVEITFGYCENHRKKKRLYGILSFVSFISAIGCGVAGGALNQPIFFVGMPFLILAALILLVLNNKTIRISAHEKGQFTIMGVNQGVLDNIAGSNA